MSEVIVPAHIKMIRLRAELGKISELDFCVLFDSYLSLRRNMPSLSGLNGFTKGFGFARRLSLGDGINFRRVLAETGDALNRRFHVLDGNQPGAFELPRGVFLARTP